MNNFKFYLSVLKQLDNLEFECLTCSEDVLAFIDLNEDFHRLRDTLYQCLETSLYEKE